jgi:hypothetical protein
LVTKERAGFQSAVSNQVSMETDVLPTGYPVARYPRKAASSWRWPAREEKVLPGVFGPCGAQARESAVFSLVLAVVYCPSASSRWCWTARHRAAGDVENPFDSYIRNPTALCRRPVFPKSTVKSTDKKKSVSRWRWPAHQAAGGPAIEQKTQHRANVTYSVYPCA